MVVFKIAKGIIKLFLGLVLGLGGIALIIWFGVSYLKEIRDFGKDVPYMVSLYENAKDEPAGTLILCPWVDCDNEFVKKSNGQNFCKKEHEQKFWEAVNAYKEMKRVEHGSGIVYK